MDPKGSPGVTDDGDVTNDSHIGGDRLHLDR